jgi:hypothetical protein
MVEGCCRTSNEPLGLSVALSTWPDLNFALASHAAGELIEHRLEEPILASSSILRIEANECSQLTLRQKVLYLKAASCKVQAVPLLRLHFTFP